jgi:DNA-binding transcriptional regulator PaaX
MALKRKNREATREISKAVLEMVSVAGFVTLAGLASNGYKADKLFIGLAGYGINRIRETIKRLKFQGVLEYDEEDENCPIVLSSKGMTRLTRHRIFSLFSEHEKWDHFWRMLLFDIPEHCCRRRRSFQMALKRAGLYRLQDSVYITPYDRKEQLILLAKLYGVAPHILIATTTSLGPFEKEARKFFFQKS